MMNLIKRLRNIYKLGELEATKVDGKLHLDYKPKHAIEEEPRKAQIIKLKKEENIINEVLQKENV